MDGEASLSAIREMIVDYESKITAVKRIEDELKIAKAERDHLEQQIIDLMLQTQETCGLDKLNIDVNGRRYTAGMKRYWRIPLEQRATAYPLLRELGLGDLISEKVDERSLTREINEIIANNDGELPDDYDDLHMETYERTSLTNRKI